MSYIPQLSQSWLVASTIAGLPHYVHIFNFEDVHSPVDKANLRDDSIPRHEKFSSIVFEEGYNLTMLSICRANDIRYRTISSPYISSSLFSPQFRLQLGRGN